MSTNNNNNNSNTSNQTTGAANRRRRIGHKIEQHIREKYNLVEDHSGRADAAYKNGTPVEIKAAKRKKKDGHGGHTDGEFYIFREPHQWLRRRDGYYIFAGIEVLRTRRVHSSELPYFSWHKSGHTGRGNDLSVRFKVTEIF